VLSRNLLVLGSAAVLALGIAACGGDDDDDDGGSSGSSSEEVSGTIRIDGSSTVQPFAQAAAELFAEENPDVDITVGAAGTGGGFEKFCAGETDISDASRPIEPEEKTLCKDGNVEYTEIQVANDGISVTTNPALEISCMTTDQLAQLWEKNSDVTNYSDLGQDADTGEPLPDAEVSLYGPGTDSGTFEFFTEEVVGEEGNSRSDYQPSEDDNVLVTGVSGDDSALGYFGFSYYEQNTPLSRPLFMYPSAEAMQKPEVAAFMQYVVDNYDSIAEAALIVPMDDAQASEATSALESAMG
jgi:phosphate transport system substrate-binding protein